MHLISLLSLLLVSLLRLSEFLQQLKNFRLACCIASSLRQTFGITQRDVANNLLHSSQGGSIHAEFPETKTDEKRSCAGITTHLTADANRGARFRIMMSNIAKYGNTGRLEDSIDQRHEGTDTSHWSQLRQSRLPWPGDLTEVQPKGSQS